MNPKQIKRFLLLSLGLLLIPDTVRTEEGGEKLIVHIRSAAVTLNHPTLKNEGFAQEIADSLQKLDGVTRTRALPASGMVEARFATNKITGEQVANAARKILEEKLVGKKIEAQNLSSHKASSKIVVKSLGDNRVQLTSERFY